MAISNIIPRKIMRNRIRHQSMVERLDYDQKAEKTQDGELVSSYMCLPETAAEEFEISKQLYYQITGRSQPEDRDVKQMISNIKVMDKDRLLIRFKDGTEVEQMI